MSNAQYKIFISSVQKELSPELLRVPQGPMPLMLSKANPTQTRHEVGILNPT